MLPLAIGIPKESPKIIVRTFLHDFNKIFIKTPGHTFN